MQFLSELVTDDELQKLKPGRFNVIAAPRGAGKTTFMFDERILRLARDRKHIIYLIHNNAARDAIVANHSDKATFLDDAWVAEHEGIDLWGDDAAAKLVVMCYQTLAALIRNRGPNFLDTIDLIVWDEFDDIRGYYDQEIKRLRKLLPELTPEHIASLLEQGNSKSVISFIYQIKRYILDPSRIVLLAISATPELAANLFEDYLNFIVKGKLQEVYAAQETVVIESVGAALRDGTIKPGRKFWCYAQRIADELYIEKLAREAGFKTVSLWSSANVSWKDQYTPEKAALTSYITQHHCLPPDCDCDFLIVNGVVGRSVDWYDTSFQDWICNSTEYEELGQFIRARFAPKRQYLLKQAYGLVESIRNGPNEEFYEWHTTEEMKKLLEKFPIYDENQKKFSNWNQVRKYFSERKLVETRHLHSGIRQIKLLKK